MALTKMEIEKIMESNGLKKDIYHLIKYSDEIKELAIKNGNILNRTNIINILNKLRSEDKIIQSTSISNFLRYAVDILGLFEEITIFDERKGETLSRYIATYTKVSPYEIALSLLSKSFLTHYSALYINDLTINNPKDIYINKEQSKKHINSSKNIKQITQGRVDYAFSKKMRSTSTTYNFSYHKEFYRVHVLNSKNTQNTGVISAKPIGFSKQIEVTNVERTLIDVVVRPKYSGGVKEILESYIRAEGKVNIDKLLDYLDKFDYAYPYHKSILFFLKYAKYDEKDIAKIILRYNDDPRNKIKFYVDYQIVNRKLDEETGVYYPKILDVYKNEKLDDEA